MAREEEIGRMIGDVEAATKALAMAYDALLAIDQSHPVHGATVRAQHVFAGQQWATHLREVHAEHIRPKGPPIALEYVGDGARVAKRCAAEFVRATASHVIVRHKGAEHRYRRNDGEEVGKETSHASGQVKGWRNPVPRWRVPTDERARVDDLAKAPTLSEKASDE